MKLTKIKIIKEEIDKATYDALSKKERAAAQKIQDIMAIFEKAKMNKSFGFQVGTSGKGAAMAALEEAAAIILDEES